MCICSRVEDFSYIGYVQCSEWSLSDRAEPNNESDRAESTINPRTASDWALVRLQRSEGLACNEFKLPGLLESQKLDGYIKNQDLSAGEVMVCAVVSGFQQAFLSGKSSRIIMAGNVFEVRSLSLENTLGAHYSLFIEAQEY